MVAAKGVLDVLEPWETAPLLHETCGQSHQSVEGTNRSEDGLHRHPESPVASCLNQIDMVVQANIRT
jgi:hypothetical protein